jgi:hypothetical protein
MESAEPSQMGITVTMIVAGAIVVLLCGGVIAGLVAFLFLA